MAQKLQESEEYMAFLHFTACIVTYVKSHYSPSLIISSNIPCKAGLGEHFFHRDAEKIGVFGSSALSGVTGLAKGNKHASLSCITPGSYALTSFHIRKLRQRSGCSRFPAHFHSTTLPVSVAF